MGPYQVLPLLVRVDLGVTTMKVLSTFLEATDAFYCYTQDTRSTNKEIFINSFSSLFPIVTQFFQRVTRNKETGPIKNLPTKMLFSISDLHFCIKKTAVSHVGQHKAMRVRVNVSLYAFRFSQGILVISNLSNLIHDHFIVETRINEGKGGRNILNKMDRFGRTHWSCHSGCLPFRVP